MKFCPNCGKRFKDSDTFCSSCSTELKQGQDDGNSFAEGLSQASEAAKNAVGNAFNEENREKVKAAANEAMDAIKNADLEKGKVWFTNLPLKMRNIIVGALICIIALIVYNVFHTDYGDKDVPEARKVVARYIEFNDRICEAGKCSQNEADSMSQLWTIPREGMNDISGSISISKLIIDEQGSFSHKSQVIGCEGVNEKMAYVYVGITSKGAKNAKESKNVFRYTTEKTDSGWKIKNIERANGNLKRFS